MRTVLAVAAVVQIGLVGSAGAAVFTLFGDGTLPVAQAGETSFLSDVLSNGLTTVTEGFEGYTAAHDVAHAYLSLATGTVGTFTLVTAGNFGASCEPICDKGLTVLDQATSPFKGRFAADGKNWLDSNDAKEMLWTAPSGGQFPNYVGFYVTDPSDVDATFKVTATNGDETSFSQDFFMDLDSGAVYYVGIFDFEGIKSIEFISDAGASKNDGYGIDAFTISATPVPEPGTVVLLGAGLAGLAAWRRRRA